MIFIAIIISLYWATSNVCRYNFTIEKTNQLNIVAEDITQLYHWQKYIILKN